MCASKFAIFVVMSIFLMQNLLVIFSVSESVRIPQPDLQVSTEDITFSKTQFSVGEYVNISVRIHNKGNQAAGTFQVRYTDNSSGTFFPPLDTLQGCPEYSEITSETAYLPLIQGVHIITIIADATNLVVESDETNNRASIEIYVGSSQNTITIEHEITPNPCKMNENVWVNGSARLITGQPASNASVKITIDAIGKEYETKTNENGEFFYQFTSPSKVGKYLLNISVNSGEFHGFASDYLEVKRQEYPNLVVREISVSPSTPYTSEKVQISVVIQNKGKENATNVLVEMLIDDSVVGSDEKEKIDSDAKAVSNCTWKAKKGTHNVTVRINGILSQASKSFKVIERTTQSLIPQDMGVYVVVFVILCAVIFVYISSKEKSMKFNHIRKIIKKRDKRKLSSSVSVTDEKETKRGNG